MRGYTTTMTGKNITNQTKINPAGDNYVAVLLEDMHDSIKILAEGQGAIIERIDGLEARLDRMEQDMDSKFQIVMDFLYRIEAEIAYSQPLMVTLSSFS